VDLGISGRTALVLGAGGGLGCSIAEALAAEGVNIAAADINLPAAQQAAHAVRDAGASAVALEWDLADLGVIDANVREIEKRLSPVDIVVNNTGGPPPARLVGQDHEIWLRYFQSMVLPVIAITDRLVPLMRSRRWGRIITSTSSGVVAPIPNLGLSNTHRSSLLGWSKTLAREVAPDGITCNVIVPGRIATQRIRALDQAKADREGKTADQVAAESAASIPIGRYGEPHEYAAVVAFLASAKASYITGSVLRVDGGLIASI
jgi:3-oxoacyl-[acyl-carrier protein] reductase